MGANARCLYTDVKFVVAKQTKAHSLPKTWILLQYFGLLCRLLATETQCFDLFNMGSVFELISGRLRSPKHLLVSHRSSSVPCSTLSTVCLFGFVSKLNKLFNNAEYGQMLYSQNQDSWTGGRATRMSWRGCFAICAVATDHG